MHQAKMKWLQRNEVQEYQEALAMALEQVDGEENVEGMQKEIRAAVENAQDSLPLISYKPEADWVTQEVCQLSLKKQAVWISWKKNEVDNPEEQVEYHWLKS